MLKIYGSSDDLIEIEGDITEEFEAFMNVSDCRYLAFSDGTMISAQYDADGIWRFNRLATGSASYEKVECPGDDEDKYSDVVTLNGPISWVVFGKAFKRVKSPA